MQTFKSQYGRKGIRVSDVCPTRQITHVLGRTHVGTSVESVETTIRDAVARRREIGQTEWTAELEEEAVRFALWRHEENRAEYGFVMGPH